MGSKMYMEYGAFAMLEISGDGSPYDQWGAPEDAPDELTITFSASSEEEAREKFLPLICKKLEEYGLSKVETINETEIKAVTPGGREARYLTDIH